jgi:membrane fusion protein, multidrug efflux system
MRRRWPLTVLAWLVLAGGARAQIQAPPVTVAVATRQDVPVLANGVGTVQAYRAVLVRARVDGTLEKIHFVEGQDVKPGSPLVEIDPRPYQAVLDQARAKLAADQAQLVNQRLDLVRYATLARTNFASRQQVDTQQAAINQQLATLQGDQAAIEAAALNVEYCHITSPIEGVVGIRLVDEGNLIHATDTTGIVTITQVHPISLLFTLPESEFPRVQDALRAAGKGPGPLVLAYTNEGGRLLSKGTLLTPSNSIDTTTGTIQLKATFDNTDRALWPGQFVAARVQLSVAHNAVNVPTSTIQHGPDGLYVYVMTPDHVAHRHDVKTDYEGDGQSVVTQGLEGGETVIVSGQVRVSDGEKVDPRTQAAG